MKKLITICLLLATTFASNAQQMNFDETVKYINDKIECCAESKGTISVTRNGEIRWDQWRINLFDLVPFPTKSASILMENSGIQLWDFGTFYKIHFQITKEEFKCPTYFKSQADAERVFKAYIHLRSLCTKEKDPF